MGRVYAFKRRVTFEALTTSDTLPFVSAAYRFRLGDLPSYTEFTTLFDSYRLTGVKMVFTPRINSTYATNNLNNVGILYYARDLDDSTNTDLSALMQYQDTKFVTGYNAFSVYIRPKVTMEVYNTSVTSAYSMGSPWIDNNYPFVPYYGLKVYWDNTPLTEGVAYDVNATYYVKFKGVR